jgi:hypothetical protein
MNVHCVREPSDFVAGSNVEAFYLPKLSDDRSID